MELCPGGGSFERGLDCGCSAGWICGQSNPEADSTQKCRSGKVHRYRHSVRNRFRHLGLEFARRFEGPSASVANRGALRQDGWRADRLRGVANGSMTLPRG